ncbi:hypothetical protein B4098_0031 [Heyndrickxia coagulans]|uniref:Uncharacterized protein n=1 Tax=Heyndrickxia coagulans TaxID=1398 RepID=A0A150JR31_HEYCO|nr:hypothetical protein B4098_0031 [Heyndrickxia coagulans]
MFEREVSLARFQTGLLQLRWKWGGCLKIRQPPRISGC